MKPLREKTDRQVIRDLLKALDAESLLRKRRRGTDCELLEILYEVDMRWNDGLTWRNVAGAVDYFEIAKSIVAADMAARGLK